jgi:hypothetical protein
MSQLHLFLSAMDDTSLNQLEDLNLRGKEKEILDYTLRFRHKEFPDSDTVAEKLKVSKTHLYKLNSVILSKCFCLFFKNDVFALLDHLKQKGLLVLMRSEAKTAEQSFIKKASATEREQFYLRLFHLFIDVPYKFFDKKTVRTYGEKYLANKAGKTLSDQLYVEHHILFADCNRCAALKNPIKTFGTSEQELLKKEKELEGSQHYLAQYYLYRTLISFYTWYQKNPEHIKPYLKKCIALKEEIRYFFPVDIGQFLNLLYADRLFAEQNIEEAYAIFKKEFEKGVKQNMYGYHSHCEQYSLLCILKGETEKAKQLLDKVFSPLIELKADILATRGCLSFAKLYLSQNDFRLAMQYIQTGMSINEKTTYLPFELQLRLLETICFYRKKDYLFGERLAARNLKFVLAQNDKPLLADYIELFRIIIQFCKVHLKGKKIAETDREELLKYDQKYLNIYCGLLAL